MTDWATIIAETQAGNPHLEPNLHDLLPLIRDVDGEVAKRGAPYPATLRCIVALCAKADPGLVEALAHSAEPPTSADDLLVAYSMGGGGNWHALGQAAGAWLQAPKA